MCYYNSKALREKLNETVSSKEGFNYHLQKIIEHTPYVLTAFLEAFTEPQVISVSKILKLYFHFTCYIIIYSLGQSYRKKELMSYACLKLKKFLTDLKYGSF